MEEDYKKVLERIKLGYDKSKVMLEAKKKQQISITGEIEKLTQEIAKLNYDISILSKPHKKNKIVLKENGLGKDILALIISLIIPFIAIPSITFMLTTNTGWALIISKIIAIVATIFIPSFIIYTGFYTCKHFQKATDDLIDADILIKNGSLEKSQDWLKAKQSKKHKLLEEKEKITELIRTLNEDMQSYAISYNTISTKILDKPTAIIPLETKEKTLSRRKI